METSTYAIIETAVCADESITPEQAGLILNIIHGKAKHLTTQETATVCGCCIEAVRRWTWSGELEPCDNVSGCYRFAPSDVWHKIVKHGELDR